MSLSEQSRHLTSAVHFPISALCNNEQGKTGSRIVAKSLFNTLISFLHIKKNKL
jgi:hypothetical protein